MPPDGFGHRNRVGKSAADSRAGAARTGGLDSTALRMRVSPGLPSRLPTSTIPRTRRVRVQNSVAWRPGAPVPCRDGLVPIGPVLISPGADRRELLAGPPPARGKPGVPDRKHDTSLTSPLSECAVGRCDAPRDRFNWCGDWCSVQISCDARRCKRGAMRPLWSSQRLPPQSYRSARPAYGVGLRGESGHGSRLMAYNCGARARGRLRPAR